MCLNTDLYPNKTPLSSIIQASFCLDLKEFYQNNAIFSKTLSTFECNEEKDHDDMIFFQELLPSKFIGNQIFFVSYFDINEMVRLNSENIIRITSYIYIFAFLIFYTLLFCLLAKFINNYVKDIINPIKQITYKIHRTLKNLFRKKNLNKLQPDDIVIREPTEIREVAENFSHSFKKITTKNIFLNEMELGEKVSLGKPKIIHNKVSEKMLDNIKEAIEKIPDEIDLQ